MCHPIPLYQTITHVGLTMLRILQKLGQLSFNCKCAKSEIVMKDIQKLVLSAAGDKPDLSLHTDSTAPAQPAVVVAEGQVSHLLATRK